ncbi:MAG: nitroreductase family protein [Bacteroidetes bacterium]|nr:nitroreductase family protein [Bacteroidota bacterium]
MKFSDLALQRYSCRKYLPIPIKEENLEYILECGRIAPSAANLQPWVVILLTEKEGLEKIARAYPRDWFRQAPAVLVICGDHRASWKRADGKDHCDVDIAITTDHMTLAAAELGIGSCWICNFDRETCASVLKLPASIEPIVILSLGYPADSAEPNPNHLKRKKIEEILYREKF